MHVHAPERNGLSNVLTSYIMPSRRGNSEIDLLHSEPADEGEARTVAGSGPKPEGAVRRRGGVTSGGLAISEVGDNVDGAVKVITLCCIVADGFKNCYCIFLHLFP